ncbi:MAG: FHA domain-containing protein [Gammaproteobacteria bacterium]|nr:FHA domain-containing protein [Gammaproteobacteria bacterium]
MSDPLAGWLVIINGPGMGHVMQVGFGQNTIGRDNSERIKIDFGDGQISRQNHAMITFDPRGKQFYISQGTGSNLAYMNDAPVLAPTVLEANCEIILGETTLRFVPFCSPDFSWDNVED